MAGSQAPKGQWCPAPWRPLPPRDELQGGEGNRCTDCAIWNNQGMRVVERVELAIGVKERLLNDVLTVQYRSGHEGK
jgi:hypothetical protein